MKLLFTKNEYKEIKKIYDDAVEMSYRLGDITLEDFEKVKDIKNVFKSNSIIKYKFFTSSITVEVKPAFLEELISEYGDLFISLIPLVSSLIPTINAIIEVSNISSKRIGEIITKHTNEDKQDNDKQQTEDDSEEESIVGTVNEMINDFRRCPFDW